MMSTRLTTTSVHAVRECILDATERLLARYGYKKTTMDDVAREAGIGKGTTYLHFRSKQELTLATVDRIVDRLLDRLGTIADTDESSAVRLRKMLTTRVLFRFDSVCGYAQTLDEILASLRTAYLSRRQGYFDAEARLFAGVLHAGREDGSLAFDDANITAHTLLLATNALLPSGLTARELGKRKDVERKVERIADLLLNGLIQRT